MGGSLSISDNINGLDPNFIDMIRKTNLVLNLKRLSRNIENLLVCLKATKTKVNKIFQSDKMSSYTVTINAGNWIKENPQVTDTTKAIVRNVKI